MAASLVELVIPGGIVSLKCPRSGMDVIVEEEGFDPDADHSPHLRFFIDWVGDIYCANPEDLPEDQAAYQREIITLFSAHNDDEDDTDEDDESEDEDDEEGDGADINQNELIRRCLAILPSSTCVFEILDPPAGAYDGEICYACFDFGEAPDEPSLRLETI